MHFLYAEEKDRFCIYRFSLLAFIDLCWPLCVTTFLLKSLNNPMRTLCQRTFSFFSLWYSLIETWRTILTLDFESALLLSKYRLFQILLLYSREQEPVLISDTPMLLIEINSISNMGCQKKNFFVCGPNELKLKFCNVIRV